MASVADARFGAASTCGRLAVRRAARSADRARLGVARRRRIRLLRRGVARRTCVDSAISAGASCERSSAVRRARRRARSVRQADIGAACRRVAAPCGRYRSMFRPRPCFSASLRASSRPASERLRKPSSGRAASLAPINMPSRANAAIGRSMPSTSRCSRSTSGMVRPAVLPATIRMPWLPSGKSSREQPQVASMPGAAPKPCNRSSRTAPFAGRRPASRATCRRCGSAGPKSFGERALLGRAEHACADRIGPQDPRAVARPQPCGQARSSRAPPVADRRAPATGIPH